ncbi:hypothetical protein niasHT_008436 [Heterodera trifolii]|uniref:Uncharacterized protein n=1 Tax=Heterodera trifolii TaxID=157864 RepID=A0ABD2M4M4_9BILA
MNKWLVLVVLVAMIAALDSAVLRQQRTDEAKNAPEAENWSVLDVVQEALRQLYAGGHYGGDMGDVPPHYGGGMGDIPLTTVVAWTTSPLLTTVAAWATSPLLTTVAAWATSALLTTVAAWATSALLTTVAAWATSALLTTVETWAEGTTVETWAEGTTVETWAEGTTVETWAAAPHMEDKNRCFNRSLHSIGYKRRKNLALIRKYIL